MSNILDQTIPETAARLRSWRHQREKGANGTVVLIRYWPDVDPTECDTIAAAESALATIASPKADGQTYSGTWNIASVKSEQQQDGSIHIVETDVTSDANGVTISYYENDSMLISKTYYWDKTKAEATALDDAYDAANEVVHGRTVDVDIRDNGLDLFDVVVTIRTRQYQTIGTAAGAFSTGQFVSQTPLETVREWQQLGLTTETPRDVTAAAGYVKTQDTNLNPDGSQNVVTRERESTADADYGNRQTITAFDTTAVVTARNEDARETPEVSQTPGTIKTTESVENEFQKFDNSLTTRTATADADVANAKTITAFQTETVVTARNEAARETAETVQTQNQVVTTRSEKNEFQRYDNSITTKAATPDADVGNEQTIQLTETRTVVTARNEVARETPEGSQTPGTIVTTRSVENDFKSFDNSRETRAATAISAAEVENVKCAGYTEVNTTNLHQAAALGAPGAAVDGQILVNVDTKDEFGNYKTQTRVRENLDLGVNAYTSMLSDEVSETKKIIHAAASAPTLVSGYGSLSYRKDNDNRFYGEKTVRTYTATAYATADIEIEYIPAHGGQNATRKVQWFNISAADAATVYDNAKTYEDDLDNASAIEPEASGYILKSIKKIRHATGGLFDVERVAEKSPATAIAWVDGDIEFVVDYSVKLSDLTNGVYVNAMYYESRSSVQTFLTAAGGVMDDGGTSGNTNLSGTTWHYHGRGKYSCTRVRGRTPAA